MEAAAKAAVISKKREKLSVIPETSFDGESIAKLSVQSP
jgi:hypothetical protein